MATYRAQRQARREVTEQMLEYLHNQRDSITGSGAGAITTILRYAVDGQGRAPT